MSQYQPRIVVTAPTCEAAKRQYWRHVANRACLAILADVRHPVLTAQQASATTRGADQPSRPAVGTDLFRVRAEPIQIELPGWTVQTDWLSLDLLVQPSHSGNRLTLETLRTWPTPETTEPLFRYRSNLKLLSRRDGLSGDVIFLFETLLSPHAAEQRKALAM